MLEHQSVLTSGRVRKGRRSWFLAAVAILSAVGFLIVATRPELERNFRSWLYAALGVLTCVLVLFWFVFLSRVRWSTRLITLALLGLVGFALSKSVRVAGTASGTGLPKFAWKWTPKRMTEFQPAPEQPSPPVSDPRLATVTDTPQFLGPNRNGVLSGAGLATDWQGAQPKELWRKPVGSGWSAFAVVGGHAFTQEQRGENEAVTCYDVLSGQPVWAHETRDHFFEWQGGEGPRATPTVDQDRVFAMGATGRLDCLESATGHLVWSRNVLSENSLKNLTWGISDSPLVTKELVIVTGGSGSKGPTLLAYDRATGEPRWQGGQAGVSYSSPVLAHLAGRQVILSSNADSLTAHDPATGEVLLHYPWAPDKKMPKASQPIVLEGDRVFLSAGYGVGCVMLQIAAVPEGGLTASQLWKNLRMKTQFNSAAVRDGFIYGLDDGMFACVDAATGERKWKSGRFGSGQSLLVDDLALIQAENGEVTLAQVNPEGFREIGTIPALTSKTWNYPTLAGRYLLVRNDREAVCYELPLAAKSK
ncbi:MAG: PQQ-binding-like beta-propeller repeat protein [Chthoniobacteraceae bacterium]